MFTRLLFAIFLAVPLIEIALFIVIGQSIGLWPTLLGVLVTAFAGALLIRWQGMQALANLQRAAAQGVMPARQIGDAMLIGLGGVMLLFPGYFTDLIGILLLLPAVRALIYAQLSRRFRVVPAAQWQNNGPSPQGTIDLDDGNWRER